MSGGGAPETRGGVVKDWDAASYQRISLPHEKWAEAILERLPLEGDEAVLDAGCGTGRVTRMLIERLPRGRVVAVDGSESMVAEVSKLLRPVDEGFVADLTAFELAEPVDAIVSSAVFHWIGDHEALFTHLRAALRPGGRLEAQCGGRGNIEDLRARSAELAAREPYAQYLGEFEEPWNYAGTEETEARLAAAGFAEARAWLQPFDTVPPDPREYFRTLIVKPYLDLLPSELHEGFLDEALAAAGEPPTLRYVRLNISAVAA